MPIAILANEFHNEIALFQSFNGIEQIIYFFYALAAVLCIRPHLRQIKRYRHGEAGKGDFCHRAQYEAIFWRLAPLLYAFVIDSKLLGISVAVDIIGRLITIREAHIAERRFRDTDYVKNTLEAEAKEMLISRARKSGIFISEDEAGGWMAIAPRWIFDQGQYVNSGENIAERSYKDFASMELALEGLIATHGRTA